MILAALAVPNPDDHPAAVDVIATLSEARRPAA